jgi:putative ABC transport system ATP-binding protein
VTEPVLEIAGLTKEYPGSPPVRALDAIDLTIERGEAVAIIGPSGSGKSTLLHMMGTLDRPTSGSIAIAGRNLDGLSDDELSAVRSRHIGFVFQQFHLLPGYTALDNVADGLLYRGTPLEERRRLGRTALERVGLADRASHHAEKLSGGERQRVAVARALVGRPDIILADEPTGNLDSKMSDAVIELLSDLHRVGMTLVVITHEPDIAHRFARTVELRDGRVVHDRNAA